MSSGHKCIPVSESTGNPEVAVRPERRVKAAGEDAVGSDEEVKVAWGLFQWCW